MNESKLRQERRLLSQKVKELFGDSNDIPDEIVDVSMEEISDSIDTHEVSLTIESEYSSSEEEPATLCKDLAGWAVESGCSRHTLNNLLSILRNHGINKLPKDSRTLLQTPRSILTESKCGGTYSYIGIIEGINKSLEMYPFLFEQEILDLIINVDGLPLSKSS